ncbi:MAG: hypothetical protein L3J28_04680 [Candidatus Polarisedimenticolaceae bacterium]|nr:hypothetical protein [Candidatus Polarisedimenticolaceae bacterium]
MNCILHAISHGLMSLLLLSQVACANEVAGDERPVKERSAPAHAKPVQQIIRYEALPWGKRRGLGQNGGYITAIDNRSNQELWILKIYTVHYDDEMESDKQDLFITHLSLMKGGRQLIVKDERGRTYFVDLTTRVVQTK